MGASREPVRSASPYLMQVTDARTARRERQISYKHTTRRLAARRSRKMRRKGKAEAKASARPLPQLKVLHQRPRGVASLRRMARSGRLLQDHGRTLSTISRRYQKTLLRAARAKRITR